MCSWSCLIGWGHLCEPRESGKSKNLACAKEHQGVAILFGISLLIQVIYSTFAKKTWCLHELVSPTVNKTKKKARTKGNEIALKKPELKPFEWMMKHQEVFDVLNEVLSTAPLLGYPDFSREFILETDASLNGSGAILPQQDKDRKILVTAYASCSLCLSQRSMHNYSSAKLELLAVK